MSTPIDNTLIETAPVPSADYARTLSRGYTTLFGTLGILLLCSAFMRIDSAVVAPGAIAVENNRKTVQHLEGGIVGEILVRDGMQVKQGDVVMRLDDTRSAASADLYRKQQAIAMALEARMQAQMNLKETLVYPKEVLELASDPMVQSALEDNRRQFEGRRGTFQSALAVLESQIEQAKKDLTQARSDKQTAEQQLASINKELPPLKELYLKGLVPLPRVENLVRQEQQLKGASAKADIDLARSTERVSEIEGRQRQLRVEYAQEAATAIPDVRKTLSDVQQQLILARDTLKRVDILSPVTGMVHQLRFFTVGGVVKPGDAIVDIVPPSMKVLVKGRVAPVDIDRVRAGLPVEIRLPQFQRFQSEILHGKVRTVPQDVVIEEGTRQPYYPIDVEVERSTIPAEINDKLVAGMTTEVIVLTGERTILQFMVSPMLNRLLVSMRER
jgi:HlyD family type I secretion membrane fusion protein